jgi:hypothetical protein
MYKIKGGLEGMADILFNAPPPIEEEKGKGKAPSKMSSEELRQEAMKRLHRNGQGIFLRPEALLESMYDGSNRAGLKDGKRALSRLLEATVFVEDAILFGKDEPDYVHTCWGRVPPRTGAMVPIRRPAMNAGWKVSFTLAVMNDSIGEGQIREALDHAGLMVGVGSWRPQYGRFRVTSWEVIK